MLNADKQYTIEDIEALPEGERAELVEGRIIRMTPPDSLHEEIIYELGRRLGNHIHEKKLPCKVLTSNVAVYLFDDSTYLLPDLKVICDPSRLDRKGYHGAPDFVVEVLSPSTQVYDKVTKLNLYMSAGVKEYWIIDPVKRKVHKYVFLPEYDDEMFSFEDDIPVSLCDSFCIHLAALGF